ncbi:MULTISPECIES: hypothetical protein [unclassified Streptomyces]|nr:hypothetical protein [Streptomyces sp. NBC_00589]WTI40737.1 hypothetical protein OIC96_39950 [Streptomyces sp. NBC_00775]WUB25578.1 hypothetical protein OHA51_09780 [Streptomyces sp. NBC_00589]
MRRGWGGGFWPGTSRAVARRWGMAEAVARQEGGVAAGAKQVA